MTTRPFRRGDHITVHWGNGDLSKGRVICHNRKNKYGLSLVVLSEAEDRNEYIESFLPNGCRFREKDPCHITHGWPEQDQRDRT